MLIHQNIQKKKLEIVSIYCKSTKYIVQSVQLKFALINMAAVRGLIILFVF
jgi:hypothetical protein